MSQNIYFDENSRLIFESKKTRRYFDIIFHILVPLIFLGGPLIYAVIKGKDLFKKPMAVFLLICFTLVIGTVIIYNVRRSLRKNKTYIITKTTNAILINEEFFCTSNDLQQVIIYEFTDGDGASSHNTGIACEQKYFPLSFDQSEIQAKEITTILAHYLNADIIQKQGKMIIP